MVQGEPSRDEGPSVCASVVIPHYNDLENLGRCLALLQRQVVAEPFEILIADNNSTCDRQRLETLCREAGARLVHAPIQGAAEARNAGVAASRGTLLAFIDSDCRPEPGWLSAGIMALDQAPLVGGHVDVAVGDMQAMSPTEAFERVFAFNNARYIRDEHFSVTANMFTTRAVFDRVGGFRSGVSEDVEWGQRAAAMGYAWLYEPAARLAHPARRTWSELHRKWRRLMEESFLLARHKHSSPIPWIMRNWLMLLSTPLAVLKTARSRQVNRLRDRLGAAAILVRLRCWRFIAAHRLVVTGRSH